MNEDINFKIKRLAEEMKYQQVEEDWQKVTAKKGKKVVAETAAKATSTKVKPSTEGKVAPTGKQSCFYRSKDCTKSGCYSTEEGAIKALRCYGGRANYY